ncbi:cytochrome P450 [Russula earlei]|uniref:Cytochrome P450 n=1 Tax=Russula earlei TaxID=71964 RepID=A0ACC0U9T6_9AGAM|nr:cytochrome P450 [Russula earlei]
MPWLKRGTYFQCRCELTEHGFVSHVVLFSALSHTTNMDVYSSLPSFQHAALITILGLLFYGLLRVIHNVFFHPLARFPGPRGAACTRWWLAYMELGRGISLADLRVELHQKYGDIIRIAPNELHFARPSAFNEIYNAQNKWDKDHEFYRAFDANESFFAQRDHLNAKHRRALISNLFSRSAISELQRLIQDQLERLCDALEERHIAGKSSDLYLAFQCFSADTIATFLFSNSFDQLSFPDFHGDIIEAVDIAMPAVTVAKFSAVILWIIRNFPHWLLKIVSPRLKGVIIFKEVLVAQIKAILKDPKLLDDAPHRTIYSELLNPEANKGRPPPTVLQLKHEALVLFAAGSHTVGTTLMIGVYYLLRNPEAKQKLVEEVHSVWPILDQAPRYEDLEKLPLLTAVIKETLRLAVPTPAGLPRVVPPSGAMISGARIPGGTVVSQSALFVSFSEEIFDRPHDFLPERWLSPGSNSLENWLVVFSKGPRSCLGINLAYRELYLCLAHLFRRFDVRDDPARPADLTWSEHFLPLFEGQHLHAYCKPRDE